jgi:hypothetical protein
LDAGDDVAGEAGAVFQASAEGAGPGECAEQLVREIPVTVLDVDEPEAGALRDRGGADVAVDDALEIVVAEQDRIIGGRDAEPGIEDGMMEGDLRLELLLVAGAAEAAGVGHLQADEQIIGGGECFAVGLCEGGEQIG